MSHFNLELQNYVLCNARPHFNVAVTGSVNVCRHKAAADGVTCAVSVMHKVFIASSNICAQQNKKLRNNTAFCLAQTVDIYGLFLNGFRVDLARVYISECQYL